jgi:kynurenine formamidase
MASIVDLTVTIENCMPSHRTMPRPIYRRYLEHEESKALGLGTPEDVFTSAIEFVGMLTHIGTHVDDGGVFRSHRIEIYFRLPQQELSRRQMY